MSFTVKKSFIRANPMFELDVANHANELKAWLTREELVARDAKNPNVADIDRWVSCPRPDAPNPYVASAVDEAGNVILEIENDDPTPEDLLPLKKDALFRRLQVIESDARNAVLPVNKRPLREMMSNDIAKADLGRRDKISQRAAEDLMAQARDYDEKVAAVLADKPGLLARASVALGISSDPVADAIAAIPKPVAAAIDMDKELAALRSPEDNEFLRENYRMELIDVAISRNAAQVLHDIEDLTVETVDQFQIPDLTK